MAVLQTLKDGDTDLKIPHGDVSLLFWFSAFRPTGDIMFYNHPFSRLNFTSSPGSGVPEGKVGCREGTELWGRLTLGPQ